MNDDLDALPGAESIDDFRDNWICRCGHTVEDHIPSDFAPSQPCAHTSEPGQVDCACFGFRQAMWPHEVERQPYAAEPISPDDRDANLSAP